MRLSTLFGRRPNGRICKDDFVRSAVRHATTRVVCEILESRRLLTTYTYTVPTGNTVAYLVRGELDGQVEVRLGSPTASPSHTFTNTTGMDIIQVSSGVSGFTFVDQVPAALKPTSDGTHDGIKVLGGTGNTLRIEAGTSDTLIEVPTSTSTNTEVRITDSSSNVSYSRLGAGISNLVVRTNDVQPNDYYPSGGTDVKVTTLISGIVLTVDTGQATYSRVTLGQGNTIGEQAVVKTGQGHSVVNVQESNGDDGTNAIVDFVYASQLGLGNVLNVFSAGTAHLEQAPGTSSHTILVDDINVSGAGSQEIGNLIIADPATIADLEVITWGDARVLASSTITAIRVHSSSTASVEAASTFGTVDADGTVDFTADATVGAFIHCDGTVNVHAGADVIVQDESEFRNALNVVGTGAYVLLQETRTRVNNLTISYGGLLELEAVNQPPSESLVPRVLIVNNLDLGSPTGTLDLTDGGLILDYGGSSPSSDIRDWLDSGHDGDNSWDGPGINSSRAAEDHADSQISYITGLGHNEASNLPGLTSFGGVELDSTMVLVRYTYLGDIDFSGAVDITDLGIFATNWQSQGEWPEGDFNYDDFIDITDLGFLATNWQLGKSNPSSQTFNEAWAEVNGW